MNIHTAEEFRDKYVGRNRNRLFELIEQQFANCLVECAIKEEMFNWCIIVTATTKLANGKTFTATRSTGDLFGASDYDLCVMVEVLVHSLKHAITSAVFHNIDAPDMSEETKKFV